MTHSSTYIFLGTLILMSLPARCMEINADLKEEYAQIADAENGDQIDLEKKIDTPFKKAINNICSVLPSVDKGRPYWLGFGVLYIVSLATVITLTYLNTNNTSSLGCQEPFPAWCTPHNWCTTNVQTINCCPQGSWDDCPVYQCLSAVPQICLNNVR